MNKASVTQAWDHFRAVNGVGLRAIAMIPTDKLESHPVANMRTPKLLICHMYQSIAELTAAVVKGEATDPTPAEEKAALGIHTTDELVAWCKEKWNEAERNVASLTDAQITGTVKTPWGHDFSGHGMLDVLYNEYWHHRGQVYCYLRALGLAPHSLYDYEHNAPAYQLGAKATV